jgi:hypothetical protein
MRRTEPLQLMPMKGEGGKLAARTQRRGET